MLDTDSEGLHYYTSRRLTCIIIAQILCYSSLQTLPQVLSFQSSQQATVQTKILLDGVCIQKLPPYSSCQARWPPEPQLLRLKVVQLQVVGFPNPLVTLEPWRVDGEPDYCTAAQTSTWVSSCIPQPCQSYDVPACWFVLFRLNKNVICQWKWGAGQAMSDPNWWRQNSGITDRAAAEKKVHRSHWWKKEHHRLRYCWKKMITDRAAAEKGSQIALMKKKLTDRSYKKKAHRSRLWKKGSQIVLLKKGSPITSVKTKCHRLCCWWKRRLTEVHDYGPSILHKLSLAVLEN